MLRKLPLLTTIVLSLLFVALMACGGDDETAPGDEGTPAPATPTGAATAAPTGPSALGSATATVVVGDQTLTFKDGACQRAADDAWMVIKIGQVGSDNYFEMLVGAHPGAGPDAKPAAGGGEFTEGILVTAAQGGGTFTMAPAEGNKITITADLTSGELEGTTIDGQPISGSFQC